MRDMSGGLDPESRIIEPPDLGPHWNTVLKAAGIGALGESESELQDVCRYWIGYMRKAALRLRAKLGVDVETRLPRKRRDPTVGLIWSASPRMREPMELSREYYESRMLLEALESRFFSTAAQFGMA